MVIFSRLHLVDTPSTVLWFLWKMGGLRGEQALAVQKNSTKVSTVLYWTLYWKGFDEKKVAYAGNCSGNMCLAHYHFATGIRSPAVTMNCRRTKSYPTPAFAEIRFQLCSYMIDVAVLNRSEYIICAERMILLLLVSMTLFVFVMTVVWGNTSIQSSCGL